jgi:transposase
VTRRGGKTYRSFYLRHAYRENGQIKKETLLKLTAEEAERFQAVFGAPRMAPGMPIGIAESVPFGDAAAVLAMAKRCGLAESLSDRRSSDRKLALGLVMAQLLNPGSKVSHADYLSESRQLSSLGAELGLGEVHENDLYESLDWLGRRQAKVEAKLAAKHLKEGGIVLYDSSSSYFEGSHCPLARRGYSRDHRRDLPQVNYGLLCSEEGCPVAVEVFEGNVNDVKTLPTQVQKLKERFGLKRVVVVGDRGMVTSVAIRQELTEAGFGWITALRHAAIAKLHRANLITPSLFDEQNLAEVSSPSYPGERLVVCFNPFTKERNQATRDSLIACTQRGLAQVVARIKQKRKPLSGKAEIGIAAGAVLSQFKVQRYFKLEIEDDAMTFGLRQEVLDLEARLDGIYVVRTTVPPEEMSPEQVRANYLSLARVERAFRCLKSVDLQIRPIRHHLEHRVRAHVFLCMLAYYLEWHLRQAWVGLIQEPHPHKEGQSQRRRRRRGDAEIPPHSFRAILRLLRSQSRNRLRIGDQIQEASVISDPTSLQAKALRLVGVA